MNRILEKICNLPTELKTNTNTSIFKIIQATGFAENESAFDEELLSEFFKAHPNLVNEWVNFSEDQRCTPAWYLEQIDTEIDEWVVGYLERPGHHIHRLKYRDKADACAKFVIKWLEHHNAR